MTTDKLVREALEAARCSVPRGGVTDCHGYKCRQSNCLACCGEDAYEHSDTLEKIEAALASLSAQPEGVGGLHRAADQACKVYFERGGGGDAGGDASSES